MTGFVYAMISANGLVKIGWSTDPIRRLTKINCDSASPARIVGAVAATKRQEAEILGLLKPWRSHHSWHRNEGAVCAFVTMLPVLCPRLRRNRWGKLRDIDLARALSVDRATVSRWVNGKRVPAERVLEIERLTGISRNEIRPDLYPLVEVAA